VLLKGISSRWARGESRSPSSPTCSRRSSAQAVPRCRNLASSHFSPGNTQAVETYLDGFRKNDHAQILSCLTDDIEWTVFGAFHLTGKQAYDNAIEGPGFAGLPQLEVVRMIEQDDIVMAELVCSVTVMRMSMAEVFVRRDGKIAEPRARVIELKENNYR
jgi:ketosteroid isomerase-like protein